ncbi:3-phosphoshikimate 1-carboxyvinyltransferase [Candidatus Omnitrophota bacterium]
MKKRKIEPARRLRGSILVPGDKSISHRSVMIGAISKGRTSVKGLLDCDDCNYTIRAFRNMGVRIFKDPGGGLIIEGRGLRGLKRPPGGAIYLGESGTTMRILAGILAGQRFGVILKGGASLSRRPMLRIVEPLSRMGIDIRAKAGRVPPLAIIGGPSRPIKYRTKVASAQVKSCILMAGLYADGITTVTEPAMSRDHTERMLKYFGADISRRGLSVSIRGSKAIGGRKIMVPGDISSAAFFLGAAVILPDSELTLKGVGLNPTRSGVISVLKRMGARIKIKNRTDPFEPAGDIEVGSGATRGTIVEAKELPGLIDEVPIIAVVASRSSGRTVIKGAKELRVKETDRIRSISANLNRMGAKVAVRGDTIVIDGVKALRGSKINAYGDHRTAMALSVAALSADGVSELDDERCVAKSFPGFFKTLDRLRR